MNGCLKLSVICILLILVGLYSVIAEQASSFIHFNAIGGGSAGYYRKAEDSFGALAGTLGIGCHLLFWDSVNFDYNFLYHSSFLLDPGSKLKEIHPYYSSDVWIGYRFDLSNNYILSPQVSFYHRSIPSVDLEFIGGRFGINNIFIFENEESEIAIDPFIAYSLKEASYGLSASLLTTGDGVGASINLSYEYGYSFQLFMMYFSLGFTIF
jgi:hypothetical protein